MIKDFQLSLKIKKVGRTYVGTIFRDGIVVHRTPKRRRRDYLLGELLTTVQKGRMLA